MKEAVASYQDQQQLLKFFTPFYAKHIGRIMSLNGNSTLENWITRQLYTHILTFNYPNMFQLRSDPELLKSLNKLLGNDALLSVDLKSLATLVTDKLKQLWFNEVLDNHLMMWELNV